MDQMPNLGREKEMLEVLGLKSMDDLFTNIPDEIRRKDPLPLPPPQSEEEIWSDAVKLLGSNVTLDDKPSFLSAGLVRNFVPTAVGMLATRGEFLTSYTPYQPEVSQGMLQAMWEFQTMISELVGLPVANVSMYDASTAAAEAITCAVRVHNKTATQKGIVYVSEYTPPHRLAVIRNYTQGGDIEIKLLKHLPNGNIDITSVKDAEGCCAVYVEQPNCFGVLDSDLVDIKEIIGNNTALIVGIDSVSLGIIAPPGSWGADIVVGEGQPFGIGPTAGGPIYGIFACGSKYTRQMPGRIVGLTKDTEDKRAFTLTLSTREQHIRRHRATSNICSNETLIALMGAIHMSLLGPEGLERLALRVAANTKLAKDLISPINGIELVDHESSNFREFRVKLPRPTSEALSYLDDFGVIAGLDLGIWFDSMSHYLLIGVDERTSKSDINKLSDGLSMWLKEEQK